MWKLLLFVFCTPKIFSAMAQCSLAGSCQTMLRIYHLTLTGPRWQATSLSPPSEPQISFYDIQQVLEISAKIWLIWDCKFRYLIVICASSLIISVSVTRSEGVIVCLWLRSELLTAVACLPCWDVTPCSLIDMCQECNWAQGNQT